MVGGENFDPFKIKNLPRREVILASVRRSVWQQRFPGTDDFGLNGLRSASSKKENKSRSHRAQDSDSEEDDT